VGTGSSGDGVLWGRGPRNKSGVFVRQTAAGMKSPWRSMWTWTGMEARPISSQVLASRTSRNGETFGSAETTEDKITPERETVRMGRGGGRGERRGGLTVVFLHGSRRRHEHRLRGEAVLLGPLHVAPGDDVELHHLLRERTSWSRSLYLHPDVCFTQGSRALGGSPCWDEATAPPWSRRSIGTS